jgi:hypothetical protein
MQIELNVLSTDPNKDIFFTLKSVKTYLPVVPARTEPEIGHHCFPASLLAAKSGCPVVIR